MVSYLTFWNFKRNKAAGSQDISEEFKIDIIMNTDIQRGFKKDVSLISPNFLVVKIIIFLFISYQDFKHHEDK